MPRRRVIIITCTASLGRGGASSGPFSGSTSLFHPRPQPKLLVLFLLVLLALGAPLALRR
eukprot:scaffold91644_cov54-Phaeocystis_antarctica.AAC.3